MITCISEHLTLFAFYASNAQYPAHRAQHFKPATDLKVLQTWCTTPALEYAYCKIQISKPKLSANQFPELIDSVASDVNMFQR